MVSTKPRGVELAVLAALVTALTRDSSWTDTGKLAGDTFNELATLAEGLDAAFWHQAADNAVAVARWLDAAAAALLDLRDRLQPGTGEQLARDWEAGLQTLAQWRRNKRQLHENTMPPKSELKPNLFGALGRRRTLH